MTTHTTETITQPRVPHGYELYASTHGHGYQWRYPGCPRARDEETEHVQSAAEAADAAWEDLGEPDGYAARQIDEPGDYYGHWELRLLDPDDPEGAGEPSDDSYATRGAAIRAAWQESAAD